VKDRSDEIKADIDEKISRSEEELEEIEEELEEIDSELESVDKEIAEIREEQPALSDVDGRIERVIRNNDYDFSAIVEEIEEELERYQSSIDEIEEVISEQENKIEELEAELESPLKNGWRRLKTRWKKCEKTASMQRLRSSQRRWQEIFEKMAGEIGLEIQMMQDGDIEIPGAEGPRKYDRAGDLSDAEITFMNISFAVAYNRFVRESDTTEWSTIVCDEPFSNLDAEGRVNLLEFIESCDDEDNLYVI